MAQSAALAGTAVAGSGSATGPDAVADLVALKMGVRVDHAGVLKMDYQTAGGTHLRGDRYGVARANAGTPDTVQSNRYYLADADFLVGLEGDLGLLRQLDAALAAPVWQLFLGRKSYVPGIPIRLPDDPPQGPGLRDEPLDEALRTYPWPGSLPDQQGGIPSLVRLVLERQRADAEVRRDLPISFATRQFGIRTVITEWLQRPEEGDVDVSLAVDTQST